MSILKQKHKENKKVFKSYINLLSDDKEREYICNRIEEQILYYDNKSKYYKNCYRFITVVSLLASSCIPIMTVIISEYISIKIIIAILASIVTVMTSLEALFGFKNLWIQYRISCEQLKSITFLYITQNGIYSKLSHEEAFNKYVTICEDYFANEFDSWKVLTKDENKNVNALLNSN